MIAATESTIYPLLRRLLNDRCLTSSWKESSENIILLQKMGKNI